MEAIQYSIHYRSFVLVMLILRTVDCFWNVMAHGDAREGKWRGNWRMEWVASSLHTTSEHGVSSITTVTTADAHTSAASSRLSWRPCRFKWTRPFRRKTKSGFCAYAITFQTQSTTGSIFYGWPEHGCCHVVSQRMQAFYATELLCCGGWYKKHPVACHVVVGDTRSTLLR
jgi:hypothetical protein